MIRQKRKQFRKHTSLVPDGIEFPEVSTMEPGLLNALACKGFSVVRSWLASSAPQVSLGCFLIELTEKTYGCLGILPKTALLASWVVPGLALDEAWKRWHSDNARDFASKIGPRLELPPDVL